MSLERSAHTEIMTKDGKPLYVNRLARGVGYDVLWISERSRACAKPSDGKDIILMGQAGYPLYYQLPPNGSLLLFVQGRVAVPPGFSVTVKQEDVNPLDWQDIEKRHALGEVQRVSLDLPKSDPCLVRW